jgi:hypothetical protein
MSLFDNAGETNLRACAQMVEDVLAQRGLDAAHSRVESEAGPAWSLRQGSAQVLVFLTAGDGGQNTIQVIAPVLRATAESLGGPKLLRRLLELNAASLTQAAFGLRGEDVVLTSDRNTAGLDPVEVDEMIRRVADYADHYDDALVAEFGGKRHSDL